MKNFVRGERANSAPEFWPGGDGIFAKILERSDDKWYQFNMHLCCISYPTKTPTLTARERPLDVTSRRETAELQLWFKCTYNHMVRTVHKN